MLLHTSGHERWAWILAEVMFRCVVLMSVEDDET